MTLGDVQAASILDIGALAYPNRVDVGANDRVKPDTGIRCYLDVAYQAGCRCGEDRLVDCRIAIDVFVERWHLDSLGKATFEAHGKIIAAANIPIYKAFAMSSKRKQCQAVKINYQVFEEFFMPVFEQPMRKLLGTLSPTISWLNEKGAVDVSSVPESHLEAIKQLERIGVVHKRNNRSYELQKIRLKKLLGNLGIDELVKEHAAVLAAEALVASVVAAQTEIAEPVLPMAASELN